MKWYGVLIIAALTAVIGFLFGRGWIPSEPLPTGETVRVDTAYYPLPPAKGAALAASASVRVPIVLYAPTDTLRDTVERTVVVKVGADSAELRVAIERRLYQDSTYRLQVSGAVIGNVRPKLDWIQTYDRTVMHSVTKRSRFAITAGVGVGYVPEHGLQPQVGVNFGVILWQF